jgi:hypothetical protein
MINKDDLIEVERLRGVGGTRVYGERRYPLSEIRGSYTSNVSTQRIWANRPKPLEKVTETRPLGTKKKRKNNSED